MSPHAGARTVGRTFGDRRGFGPTWRNFGFTSDNIGPSGGRRGPRCAIGSARSPYRMARNGFSRVAADCAAGFFAAGGGARRVARRCRCSSSRSGDGHHWPPGVTTPAPAVNRHQALLPEVFARGGPPRPDASCRRASAAAGCVFPAAVVRPAGRAARSQPPVPVYLGDRPTACFVGLWGIGGGPCSTTTSRTTNLIPGCGADAGLAAAR